MTPEMFVADARLLGYEPDPTSGTFRHPTAAPVDGQAINDLRLLWGNDALREVLALMREEVRKVQAKS